MSAKARRIVPFILWPAAATGEAYSVTVARFGPIAHWPLTESSGTTAADLIDSPDQDGTYSGVTLAATDGPISGELAPSFDGVNDEIDAYSTTLRDKLLDVENAAVGVWLKIPTANWAAGGPTGNDAAVKINWGADYLLVLRTGGLANEISGGAYIGAGSQDIRFNVLSRLGATVRDDWLFCMIATDKRGSGDYLFTVNGVRGISEAISGTSLAAALSAVSYANGGSNWFEGNLAHAVLFDRFLPQFVMSELASVNSYLVKQQLFNPIAQFPLNETSGTSAFDQQSNQFIGTHGGVTLDAATGPDGVLTAPSFDGVNDYTDIYTAALAAAFNGAEGAISLWAKKADWGSAGYILQIAVDASNYVRVWKAASSIYLSYAAGGVAESLTKLTSEFTDGAWHNLTISWSAALDTATGYSDGVQFATSGTLGTWAGALDSTLCAAGASNSSGGGATAANISAVAIYDHPLSYLAVARLADTTQEAAYIRKVLSYQPIGYWPLIDASGAVAGNLGAGGDARLDAVASGVTWGAETGPDGALLAPSFDGVNDKITLDSTKVADVFNPDNYTVFLWFKMSSADVWSDGTQRRLFIFFEDGSNWLLISKETTTNRLQFWVLHQTLNRTYNHSVTPDALWHSAAISFDSATGLAKYYYDGTELGSGSGLSAMALTSPFNYATIGTNSSAQFHDGSIAHFQLYGRTLTAAEIANLASAT